MMSMKLIAHLAQMLVKPVIYQVLVLLVELTETHSQIVLVNHIILKPLFKNLFSVKFVMLDVENVPEFSIIVLLVPLIPTEKEPHNVPVQLDIMMLVVIILITTVISLMLNPDQVTDVPKVSVNLVNLNVLLVQPQLQTVPLVLDKELIHHIAIAQMVNMLTNKTSVPLVLLNVRLAQLMTNVHLVMPMLIEETPLLVYVWMDIMIMVLMFANLVELLAPLAKLLLTTVLLALKEELESQIAHVTEMLTAITMEIVFLVLSDVMDVTDLIPPVSIALETEPINQLAIAQLNTTKLPMKFNALNVTVVVTLVKEPLVIVIFVPEKEPEPQPVHAQQENITTQLPPPQTNVTPTQELLMILAKSVDIDVLPVMMLTVA